MILVLFIAAVLVPCGLAVLILAAENHRPPAPAPVPVERPLPAHLRRHFEAQQRGDFHP